jgi:hypothetical protein
MADDDVIERAMVANGYTIKKHGGAFRWGVARPLEDKARVTLVYLCLKEVNPDSEVSIREVEGFAYALGVLPKKWLMRLRTTAILLILG